MASVANTLKALVVADPIEAMTKRLAAIEAESATATNERSKAASDLFAAEAAASDARSGDAAERIAAAERKLALLTMRRAAVHQALAEAKSARVTEEKKGRVESLTLALDKASKAADTAEAKAIAAIVALGETLAKWAAAGADERSASAALDREQPEVSHPRRGHYLSTIEARAMEIASTLSSYAVKVPR